MVAGHVGGIHGRLLRGKRRSFARSSETERAGALPGEHVTRLVGDSHDGVIERRLNVHHSKGDVLALLLFEGLFLPLLVWRGCAGCWLGHESSPKLSSLSFCRRLPLLSNRPLARALASARV